MTMLMLWSRLASQVLGADDDYIVCMGHAPETGIGLYPPERDNLDYYNIYQLCSAAHGHQYNMGCLCPGPGPLVNPECSIANGADSILFNYRMPATSLVGAGMYWLRSTCQSSCTCLSPDDSEAFREEPLEEQKREEEDASDPYADLTASGGSPRVFAGKIPAYWPSPGGVSSANSSGQCTDFQACYSVGDNCSDSCLCRITSSTVDTKNRQLLYAAACSLPLSLSGKREAASPCPCNTTYVSHACCDARHTCGIVHEPLEMKMGEMIDREAR